MRVTAVARFQERLLAIDEARRALFPVRDMTKQGAKLVASPGLVVHGQDRGDTPPGPFAQLIAVPIPLEYFNRWLGAASIVGAALPFRQIVKSLTDQVSQAVSCSRQVISS